MSNENITSVAFNELTPAEQAIVSQAIGWDGNQYHDAKSGIRIELVDGEVATYRVVDKGDQVVAEPVAEAPAEVAPEAPAEVQATEPAPAPEATAPATESTDTNASEQNTTEPAPENGDVNASAPADTANEPAPTE